MHIVRSYEPDEQSREQYTRCILEMESITKQENRFTINLTPAFQIERLSLPR